MSAPLLLRLPAGGGGWGGFTSTRQGGVSAGPWASLNLGLNTEDDPAAVAENRRRAFGAVGLDAGKAVFLQQVHGEEIREAGPAEAGRGSWSWEQALPACDAVFTRTRGLALAIGHADCLAVALADVEAGLLGLAHAGWRGALAGLPGKLARRLQSEGARPGGLRAVLSPCLGPAGLQLGEEQHRLFGAAFARPLDFSTPLSGGRFHLDLWACARAQLLEAGLQAGHIQGQELDTAGHPELFFSHRRDAGRTGRMLTVAYLE